MGSTHEIDEPSGLLHEEAPATTAALRTDGRTLPADPRPRRNLPGHNPSPGETRGDTLHTVSVGEPKHRGLRDRLAIGLGVMLAMVLAGSAALVLRAREDERVVAQTVSLQGLARRVRFLGVLAREQYIHEAHTIIVGDHSHVGHHGSWVEVFRRSTSDLARDVAPEDRGALAAIVANSARLERTFAQQILPAVDRNDRAALRASHDDVERTVATMTDGADALAQRLDERVRAQAEGVTAGMHHAVALSLALAVLAALVAAGTARWAWSAVNAPLTRLRTVAEAVGRGDTRARVGLLRERDLAVVALAFDRMLDELAAREAALVRAERLAAIGEIAAGVAHEINNPIGVIRGYLKPMLREAPTADLRGELQILDDEAFACQRIVEDLLTYARVPALERRPTALDPFLRECAERSITAAELEGHPVHVVCEPLTVAIDPQRMRQVLANLLRNAAQSMCGVEGGVIELRARREGGLVEISVEDRGPGVDPTLRAEVFEPFVTSRTTGTGLGLAVSDGIVQAHDGTLSVRERVGGGSRFVVSIPVEIPS